MSTIFFLLQGASHRDTHLLMQNERIGDWFTSVSGRKIYVADPRPEDIDINDIITGLSNICRFGGQIDRNYTVLEHSLLVAYGVADELMGNFSGGLGGDEIKVIRTALMHDSPEALIGDVVKPFKLMDTMSGYREIEDKWERVIAEKYDLFYPLPDIVKRHDNRALATEFRDLRPRIGDVNWKCKSELPYIRTIKNREPNRRKLIGKFGSFLIDVSNIDGVRF